MLWNNGILKIFSERKSEFESIFDVIEKSFFFLKKKNLIIAVREVIKQIRKIGFIRRKRKVA